MTNQPGMRAGAGGRSLDLRGVVDLGALAKPPAAAGGARGGAKGGPADTAGAFVIDVTEATFATEVMQVSQTVPVVLDFASARSAGSRQLSPVLDSVTAEHGGRVLLARVDADTNPQIAQAFGVQALPSVFAVVMGQPLPLFQGPQQAEQVRQVFAELLRVAEANGVTGRLPAPETAEDPDGEPVEESLPPLHQAAYDAIENDDLDTAIAAYQQALLESPADDLARVGLAQVQLMKRTNGVDPVQARATAAADPADPEAQIIVADLDVLGGHIEDAFARLIDTVRVTSGDDRDKVRAHLVELFEVVGKEDPRVTKARISLAGALF